MPSTSRVAGTLLLIAALSLGTVAAAYAQPQGSLATPEELERMQLYVRGLYAEQDVHHTFLTEAGDLIDCVDVYAQPAMRRPEMKGHVIRFAPETEPGSESTADSEPAAQNPRMVLYGGVDEMGRERACPAGTIPIRRVTLDVLKNFRTLEDFLAKYPRGASVPSIGTPDGGARTDRLGPTDLHQYAHARRTIDNRGAEAYFNRWNMDVERDDEFSLSQIWVTRGSGSSLETVEVGLQQYNQLYGDDNTRLFIYYTPDNYSTGCYNLTCAAFVQTDSSVPLGGKYANYSVTGGTQYALKLYWYKESTTGNWWLKHGEKWVGYYPRSLFDSAGLRDKGATIDFGGEIIDAVTTRHTRTDMGSGRAAAQGYKYSAFVKNIRYLDVAGAFHNATGLTTSQTDSKCYNILLTETTDSWGVYFFHGGPGYNSECQ